MLYVISFLKIKERKKKKRKEKEITRLFYCKADCHLLELQAIVSEEDGMESIAHRFLSAAIKV